MTTNFFPMHEQSKTFSDIKDEAMSYFICSVHRTKTKKLYLAVCCFSREVCAVFVTKRISSKKKKPPRWLKKFHMP